MTDDTLRRRLTFWVNFLIGLTAIVGVGAAALLVMAAIATALGVRL